MLDLSVCTSGDILVFGKKLWAQLKESSTCFEQAAQLSVESFYKELGDAEGQPAFALVRLYTEMAQAIAAVTPYITTSLASFDENHKLWR